MRKVFVTLLTATLLLAFWPVSQNLVAASQQTMPFCEYINIDDSLWQDSAICIIEDEYGDTLIPTFNNLTHFINKSNLEKVLVTHCIQDIRDMSIIEADKIHLQYNQNNFTIYLGDLDYETLHKHVRYQLIGVDEDWRDLNNSHLIAYSHINAGQYEFKILVLSDDGDILDRTTLSITIDAPFYQTVWFYILLAMAVILLIYSIIILRSKIMIKQHNSFQQQLNQQTEKLHQKMQYHVQMEQKIADLYNRKCQLYSELEKDMRQRIEFNHALVHELKTPLTPIVATSEMMMEHSGDEIFSDSMRNIYKSAVKLSTKVDELFDFARSDISALHLCMQNINFSKMLDEIAYLSSFNSKRNGTTFVYEPQKLPMIYADEDRLCQVVQNMLANAHKFTPKGGEILMRSYIKESRLYVEVENSGPIIKKEERERIFERYYQRKDERGRFNGLGIGLTLARQFIRLHDGDMWMEARKRNVFIFYIPIKYTEGNDQNESINN
ncbi:MAG: ATP-binding protein [Chloroflexi bacterium]|nr:ATP-binding protein [Chloroflexota bacterium]